MDIRKAINRLLTEDHKHDYGCAMLYFDFPQIKDIHNQIDEDDLYVDEEDPSFGLENEPHCTLLFGLHPEVSTEDVQDVLSQSNIIDLPYVGNNVSLFENEYDVLKLDVSVSPNVKKLDKDILYRTNDNLKLLSHKESPYEYHPHMTIAYLKKGTGQKYVDKFKDIQFDLSPSYAVYSKPDGTQDKIEI